MPAVVPCSRLEDWSNGVAGPHKSASPHRVACFCFCSLDSFSPSLCPEFPLVRRCGRKLTADKLPTTHSPSLEYTLLLLIIIIHNGV